MHYMTKIRPNVTELNSANNTLLPSFHSN